MKKGMIKNSMGSKFAKHIIFSLLIIFSFLIAIVIAIVAISFGSDVRQKVTENKREQLRYVGENISQRVSELKRIFYGIGEDSSFYIIGNPDQTGSGHRMIEALDKFLAGNDFASYLVYYQLSNADKFYSSSGEMSADAFLKTKLGCDQEQADIFLNRICETTGFKSYPMTSCTKSSKYLMLVNAFPSFSKNPQSFVAALVQENELREMADALFMDCYGEFIILAVEDTVLYSYGNVEESLFDSLPGKEYLLSSEGEDCAVTISGEQYLFQKVYDDSLGWHYVSLIRAADIMETVNRNQMQFYLIIVAVLLCTGGLIFIFVLRKYAPIMRLAATVKNQAGIPGNMQNDCDEQTLLSATFQMLLEEKKNHYTDIFFTNLLAEQYDEDTLVYAVQEYDIHFEYPYFMAVAVSIGSKVTGADFRNVICAEIEERFCQDGVLCYGLYQRSQGYMVIFLNYKESTMDFTEELSADENFLLFSHVKGMAFSSVGIGRAYLSPLQWAASCREARDAMYYCRMTNGSRCVRYTEIEKKGVADKIISWHTRLISSCRKGEDCEVMQIRKELEVQYNNRTITELQMNYLTYNVVTSLLKYVDDAEITEKLEDVLFRLLGNEKLSAAFLNETGDLYLAIARKQKEEKHTQQSELLDKIKAVIDTHICDSMLSLECIAGYCGISASYLSRYFKQQMKCTPMSYVENMRMELVKHRLRESDLALKTIIEEVGYIDQSNFIRKFKRMEGMTPMAYRKQIREE